MLPSVVGIAMMTCSCSQEQSPPSSSAHPVAVDFGKVGKYPALTKSGAGFVYVDVLEYRVWVHSGGDDYYRAFASYEQALLPPVGKDYPGGIRTGAA